MEEDFAVSWSLEGPKDFLPALAPAPPGMGLDLLILLSNVETVCCWVAEMEWLSEVNALLFLPIESVLLRDCF